ncbi:MAG: sporulation integral membrane protein YtvI [Clostridia bacterium]|nr:sporulation integral membrane protein YtvI [Clostridia bacterium]
MERSNWEKWAAIIFCIGAAAFGGWLVFKYVFWVVMPFIISWGVALAITPAARWLSKQSRLPRRLCAAVLLVIVIGFLIAIATLAVDRLIFELSRLLDWLKNASINWDINGFFARMSEKFPLIGGLFEQQSEQLTDMLMDVVSSSLSGLGKLVPSAIFDVISRLPSIMLALVVTLLACFYFALDLDAIHAALASLFPERWRDTWRGLRTRVFDVILRWVRAYFILFLITFGLLLVGFMILGVDWALLLALLGALVDLLPVVGTGVILVPWGIWALISHDIFLGVGLLVLYVVVTVIRQIAEPHIIGGSMGVHPLLTLVAMYVGFKIFGVIGMIILPAILGFAGGLIRQDVKK